MKKPLNAEQKSYLKWLEKNLKVTKLHWLPKLAQFIKDDNKEICDFYIFRDCIQVVRLDKTAKWYRVKPAK